MGCDTLNFVELTWLCKPFENKDNISNDKKSTFVLTPTISNSIAIQITLFAAALEICQLEIIDNFEINHCY